jgi:hypothetical protein
VDIPRPFETTPPRCSNRNRSPVEITRKGSEARSVFRRAADLGAPVRGAKNFGIRIAHTCRNLQEFDTFWNGKRPQTRIAAHLIPRPVTPGVAGSSLVHSAKKANGISHLRVADSIVIPNFGIWKKRGRYSFQSRSSAWWRNTRPRVQRLLLLSPDCADCALVFQRLRPPQGRNHDSERMKGAI